MVPPPACISMATTALLSGSQPLSLPACWWSVWNCILRIHTASLSSRDCLLQQLPVSHFRVSPFEMGTRGPECVRGCVREQGCEMCEEGGGCKSVFVRVGCMCKDTGVGVESLCGRNLAELKAATAVEHSHLPPVVSTGWLCWLGWRVVIRPLGTVTGSSTDLRWSGP